VETSLARVNSAKGSKIPVEHRMKARAAYWIHDAESPFCPAQALFGSSISQRFDAPEGMKNGGRGGI
jgi:hypothetical protein